MSARPPVVLDSVGGRFAMWAGNATRVELCVFEDGGLQRQIDLDPSDDGWFTGHLNGVRPGTEYGYRVHGPWNPEIGQRFNPAKLLVDPRARAICGSFVAREETLGHHASGETWEPLERDDRDSAPWVPRSVVVDESYDWGDDQPIGRPISEHVVYEVHVRGFTKGHPDVPDELQGTYAGLAHPSAVAYLHRIGVTAVQLLPVHHFVDEPELQHRGLVNYWGYNTLGWLAPHAAYCSAGSRGAQVSEFKDMVRALHAARIAVLLDVVYNHSAEAGPDGPTLSLRGIDNAAYYRLDERGGGYADVTGCGNTLDLSSPPALDLVMESLRYWVQDMHVDGFRFDLTPALTRGIDGSAMTGPFLDAVRNDPVLRDTVLIAEPWDLGADGYQVGNFPTEWAEWNDKYRDTLRDYWRGELDGVRELGWRLTGSADVLHRGSLVRTSVNFVTSHDGFTMRDLVSYDGKHNEANGEDNRDGNNDNRSWNSGAEGDTEDPAIIELRQRRVRNLLASLLMSVGTPMVVAGDELGRTQQGNNNGYCQDNEISWLDWAPPAGWDMADALGRLTQIRRDHRHLLEVSAIHGNPESGAQAEAQWFSPDGSAMTEDDWDHAPTRALGVRFTALNPDVATHPHLLILFNPTPESLEFRLPDPTPAQAWQSVFDTRTREQQPPRPLTSGASVVLVEHSLSMWSTGQA